METQTVKSPKWWTASHAGAWNKVKDAMKTDWEKDKKDIVKSVNSAAQPAGVPPKAVDAKTASTASQANKPTDGFNKVEPAFRYGVGLSTQYASQKEWNPAFEGTVSKEWSEIGNDRPWSEAKSDVRHGFERARRA